MSSLNSILQLLNAGLSLWNHHEATKYQVKVLELKKRYHNEMGKSETERDDAVLDGIEFELRIISDSFCAAVGAKNA